MADAFHVPVRAVVTHVQDKELTVGKELDVSQIVDGLEPFSVSQRRKADFLKTLEPDRVFGPGVHDDEAIGQPAVIRHSAFLSKSVDARQPTLVRVVQRLDRGGQEA